MGESIKLNIWSVKTAAILCGWSLVTFKQAFRPARQTHFSLGYYCVFLCPLMNYKLSCTVHIKYLTCAHCATITFASSSAADFVSLGLSRVSLSLWCHRSINVLHKCYFWKMLWINIIIRTRVKQSDTYNYKSQCCCTVCHSSCTEACRCNNRGENIITFH